MAIKAAKPSDFTGRQREEAAEAAADELAKREGQITMMQQIEVQTKENEVFDPETGKSLGEVGSVPTEVDVEVPEEPVAPKVEAPKAKTAKAVKVKSVKKVTIQVVEDVNDMIDQAGELRDIARDLHAHVNLIPYNTVQGLPWKRPSVTRQEKFADVLRAARIPVTLRREKGHDIDAACGQLRLKTEKDRQALLA